MKLLIFFSLAIALLTMALSLLPGWKSRMKRKYLLGTAVLFYAIFIVGAVLYSQSQGNESLLFAAPKQNTEEEVGELEVQVKVDLPEVSQVGETLVLKLAITNLRDVDLS